MSSLINLSNTELKKELFKENIFIELSERLEVEMDRKKITPAELGDFLGKEHFYIEAILEGMLDIKISEVASIFAFFDKFTGIVPASSNERIHIVNIQEHSFATFNKSSGVARLCVKDEFIKQDFNKVCSLTVGICEHKPVDYEMLYSIRCVEPKVENKAFDNINPKIFCNISRAQNE